MRLFARRRKLWVIGGCLLGVLAWSGLQAHARFFRAFRIPTASMMPNLAPGDHIYARLGGPGAGYRAAQGDVIIYRREGDASTFVHRCVALAGDTVAVREGTMFVNGRAYESALDDPQADHGCIEDGGVDCPEPHTWRDPGARDRSPRSLEYGPIVVPAGHVFVAGDNRFNAADSRYRGPVPEDLIVGKASYIYWSRSPGRMFRRVR